MMIKKILLTEKALSIFWLRTTEGSHTKSVRRLILEETKISVPSIEKQKQILGLYKVLLHEKKIHAEMARNADKLMNAIASEL